MCFLTDLPWLARLVHLDIRRMRLQMIGESPRVGDWLGEIAGRSVAMFCQDTGVLEYARRLHGSDQGEREVWAMIRHRNRRGWKGAGLACTGVWNQYVAGSYRSPLLLLAQAPMTWSNLDESDALCHV